MLDKVLLLRTVEYTMRESGVKSIGYIAQKVVGIFPDAVHIDEKGYMSLDYTQIQNIQIAYLMREVTRLTERLEKLEAKK